MTTKKKTSPNSRATTPPSIAGKGAGGLGRFRKQSRNANKHTERGLDLLDKSIRKNGWIGAMTAANDGEIFDGSARLETVAEAMPADPIIVETDGKRPIIIKRTDIKKATDPKAVRLALEANRIAQVDLNWDVDVLGEIAAKQKEIIEDLFGDNELKKLGVQLGEPEPAPEAQMDKADELLKKWEVKTGDLWQIGEHRLLCGDCTKAEDVKRMMGKQKADMVFTDPPFGNDRGYGRGQLGIRFVAGDEDTELLFKLPEIIKSVFIGSFCVVWVQWYTYVELLSAFDKWKIDTVLIWDKKAPGLSGRGGYGEQYEMAIVFVNGKPKRNFFRGNVFTDARHIEGEGRNSHPTMKSVPVCSDILKDLSNNGDLVFDPFCGSGTTLVACERLGRKGRAIEIAPKYVAVALQRLADMGLKPKLLK